MAGTSNLSHGIELHQGTVGNGPLWCHVPTYALPTAADDVKP